MQFSLGNKMLLNPIDSNTSNYAILISLASLGISILGLLNTINNNSKFARNEFIKKQISVVIDLVSHLHNNILTIEFTTFHNGGGISCGVYNATILELPILKISTFDKEFFEQQVYFSGGCNQLSDIKKYIDNPFLPQSIADELINFYSTRSEVIKVTHITPSQKLVIKTVFFSPNRHDQSVLDTESIIRKGNAFALENWENLKACSTNLEEALRKWLNKYKVSEINIRKDFKHP